MNIPEGYVLVPVEPTEEMLEVMHESVKIEVDTLCRTASIINDKQWWSSVICASPNVKLPDYDEAKERELFESTYPLDNGVTWRAEAGNEGRYCVWIDCKGGFWACFNAEFGFQQKWEVWSKCAKSRVRSAE